MRRAAGAKTTPESTEISPATTSNSLLSKMRTRSTSTPVAAAGKTKPEPPPPSLTDAVPESAPVEPGSATVPSSGLGSFLGIRRRGASNHSSPTSPASAIPSQTVATGSGAKVLVHSQSYNASFPVPRSPSIASTLSTANGRRDMFSINPQLPISFAEFRKSDTNPRKQRSALGALHRQDMRLRAQNKIARKPFKEPKFKEEKNKKGFKLTGLLQKKKRKRSRFETFHLLYLAILDQRTALACSYLDEISSAALRRKQPALASKIFFTALGKAAESICIIMLDKGFPVSVNTPVALNKVDVAAMLATKEKLSPLSANKSTTVQKGGDAVISPTPSFELPSSFMAAVSLGLENVVRVMIKRADVNQTWNGLTPLHLAALKNWASLSQLLLDSGADPSLGILLQQYAFLHRLKSTSTATPQVVLGPNSSAPSPTEPGVARSSANRHSAYIPPAAMDSLMIRSNSMDATSLIIQRPTFDIGTVASPSVSDASPGSVRSSPAPRPSTPLSTRGPRPKGYSIIPQAGSPPPDPEKLKNEFSGWPLETSRDMKILPVELAAACGHVEIVRLMLPRMDPRTMESSAFALIVQRDAEMTALFLRSGVPADQRDAYGSSALHLACRSGDIDVVRCLVQSRANVNDPGQNGWTPLHEALSQRRYEVARLLLQYGADPQALNSAGETPKQVALRLNIPAGEVEDVLNKPFESKLIEDNARSVFQDLNSQGLTAASEVRSVLDDPTSSSPKPLLSSPVASPALPGGTPTVSGRTSSDKKSELKGVAMFKARFLKKQDSRGEL
ncbi:hypothetical protein DFJ73DRAFT_872555 [Zopfochytrium polystomum]|nr:hypothetical protein DFJ73DRAFT_872555 [Zopfochytrium polystomum]